MKLLRIGLVFGLLLTLMPFSQVSAQINVTLEDTLRNDTLFVFCYGTGTGTENLGNCNFVLDIDPTFFDVTVATNYGFIADPGLYPNWYFAAGANYNDTNISVTVSGDLNITTIKNPAGSATSIGATPELLFAFFLLVEDGNCNATPTVAWDGPNPFITRLRNYSNVILSQPAGYVLNDLNVTTLCPVQSVAASRTTTGPVGGQVCLNQTVTFDITYDSNPFNSPMGGYIDTLGVTVPVEYQLIHPTSGPLGVPGFSTSFVADTFTVAGNYTIRTFHERAGCICVEDAVVFNLTFFSQPEVTVPTNLITRCGSGVETFQADHETGTGTATFTFHWYDDPNTPPAPAGLAIGVPNVTDDNGGLGYPDAGTSTQNFLVTGTPAAPDTIFIRIQDANFCISDTFVEIQFSNPVRADVRAFLEGTYADGTNAMVAGMPALLTDLFTDSGANLGDTTSNVTGVAGFAANANLGFLFNTTGGTGEYIPAGLTMDPGQAVPANAVDLVRIDLFNANGGFTQGTHSVDSTYAWLLEDGTIANFSTGLNPYAEFCGGSADATAYFVMVTHRNHLPVISDASFTLFEAAATVVDLTDPVNIYDPSGFGAAAKVAPTDLVALMPAGNVFDDGAGGDIFQVNAMDYFVGFYANAGPANGYSRADANLDGSTNAVDYNMISDNNDALWSSMVPF